jgi:hypothetical protein
MRMLRRVLGLSAALALVSGCGGDETPSFPEEDRLLESLMEEYVAGRFRFYPVESTLAGLPGNDERLGSYSRADIDARVETLSDFHKKLMGLRPDALSQSSYLDTLWLTSLVKMELFELEERRLWERAPAFYADTIRTGIVALLLARDVLSRTDALRARLEAIPALLEQARENLGGTSGVLERHGLDSLKLCDELLTDLPLLLEDRVPSYRVAELAERSRLATRALRQLESALARAPLGAAEPEPAVLGEAGLSRYFLYREMVDREPERLLRDAEEAVFDARSRLLELALDAFPDRSLPQLLGASGAASTPGDEVSAYRDEVLEFLRRNGGEGSTPDGEIPVVVVPPYFLSSDPLRLWRPASLSPPREASLLVSAFPRDVLSRELELLTLREIAGRYRLYVVQSESPSLLRRIARARVSGEAWASWILSKELERGYGDDDPELLLRYLHWSVVDALRLSIGVRVHAFGMSLTDAERDFRVRGFLSAPRAAAEAERVAVDPGAGSAALGRLLLDELSRDYRRRHPLVTDADLERILLSESLVPLHLLRFKLLAE